MSACPNRRASPSLACGRAGVGALPGTEAAGGKAVFFEKKQQKTFGAFGFGLCGKAQPRLAKVFWFFFSKKNCFLS
jgi:hypothetical protein